MSHSLVNKLLLYSQRLEDQHAPIDMTITLRGAVAEIERLRAEVQTWINHTKTAVWSDSEECKLLTAENARLRAALERAAADLDDWGAYTKANHARAALETPTASAAENTDDR